MRYRMAVVFAAVVLASLLPSAAPSQESVLPSSDMPEGGVPEYRDPLLNIAQFTDKLYVPVGDDTQVIKSRNRDNGIVVGQAKLFELRSLEIMIESVKASLAQTSYPNASQLFGLTGRIQGVQSTSHDQTVQVTGTVGTGSQEARVASPPTVAGAAGPSASGFEAQSSLALSPTDVLAEQTSLWHQLVNLQMLMDGALSDRLIPADENGAATLYGDSVKFSPRAQAIIGFQISVDPRQEYRNAVAEATITIDNKRPSILGLGGYGDEPSLMMLLPRDKTYNSISISRDNRSFGFGAVVNVFSLGLAQDKRSETYYVAKDTDTVALERIPGLPLYGMEEVSSARKQARYRGVSFGWQFRPVFNRPAVEPGVRQVFAMLSLPASVLQDKWEGRVRVTTCWRRYDRATGAVGKPIEGTLNEWDLDDIVVPIGSGVEEALKPRIDKAQWEDAGAGNAAITIEGSNFSLGTDITCGDVVLGENSLSYSSAKRIRFVIPASAILRGDVTVIGRYGIASLRQSTSANDDPYKGIVASLPRFTQQDDRTTAVELTLSKVASPARLVTDRRPVVQLEGQLFGIGDRPFTSLSPNESEQTLTIRFSAPTELLAGARELVVRDLVGLAAIPVRCGPQDRNCTAQRAVVLSTGDPVTVAVFGSGFQPDIKVFVGGREASDVRLNSADPQTSVLTFQVDRQTALDTRYIMLTQGNQPPVLVPFSMPVSAALLPPAS